MSALLLIHILAGGLALALGYSALFAGKGGSLHRRSGRYFVYTMLVMGAAGLLISATRNVAPLINVPAALLTGYLVVTALATVRPLAMEPARLHAGAFLVAAGIGVTEMAFGFEAVARGELAFPFFLFGIVGLAAAAGDLRIVRSGILQGPRRLARHLWRMCFALLIAALSFFIGQSDEFPEAIRIIPLLALPMLVVLASMIFWLWRVRAKASPAARAR